MTKETAALLQMASVLRDLREHIEVCRAELKGTPYAAFMLPTGPVNIPMSDILLASAAWCEKIASSPIMGGQTDA